MRQFNSQFISKALAYADEISEGYLPEEIENAIKNDPASISLQEYAALSSGLDEYQTSSLQSIMGLLFLAGVNYASHDAYDEEHIEQRKQQTGAGAVPVPVPARPHPPQPFPAKADWRAQTRRFVPLGAAVLSVFGLLLVTGALATWRVLASLVGLLIFGGAIWQLALRYGSKLAPEREREHSLNGRAG